MLLTQELLSDSFACGCGFLFPFPAAPDDAGALGPHPIVDTDTDKFQV